MLGGKCEHCGSKYDLEFHHVDPSTKLFAIGEKISYKFDKVYDELLKCILLCEDCHKAETSSLTYGEDPEF